MLGWWWAGAGIRVTYGRVQGMVQTRKTLKLEMSPKDYMTRMLYSVS